MSAASAAAGYDRGVRLVPYDLVKELAIALAAMLALTLVLAAVFSSPDVPPETIHSWAKADPVDFVTTATGELQGSTTSAGYGPPYNTTDGSQAWGPLSPEAWAGVQQPVDSAGDFVMNPLKTAAASDSELQSALQQYSAADGKQQSAWLDAYGKALAKATAGSDGQVQVESGDYGPVPDMMSALLRLAQAGALDGLLLDAGHFYNTDYTRPLLFMGDGSHLSDLAQQQHLQGDQWGMMNETGSYPGQSWLWLYTLWYQIPPFTNDESHAVLGVSSANADLVVILVMVVLTVLLALVPWIPGLRDIPRWIPVHRLIWRE